MHLFLRAWGVTCGWLLLPGWWLSVRRSQIPNRPWASLVSVFQNPSMVCVEVVVPLHFQYIYTAFTFTFPYIKWFPHWREQISSILQVCYFFFSPLPFVTHNGMWAMWFSAPDNVVPWSTPDICTKARRWCRRPFAGSSGTSSVLAVCETGVHQQKQTLSD